MAEHLVWILVRQLDHKDQPVSSRTGFTILCNSSTIVQQDSIGYLPYVNFSATDLPTVFEVLNRSVMIMRSLKLNKIVRVF